MLRFIRLVGLIGVVILLFIIGLPIVSFIGMIILGLWTLANVVIWITGKYLNDNEFVNIKVRGTKND